jgi:DNA polymerase-3 subunit alpha
MASVMTRKSGDVSVISFLSEECRRMGIEVLGPNVNESDKMFTVNSKGNIRFSLSAIKGFGEAAADDIIKERKQNGDFKDFFDMMQRVNLRSVNKRAIEALAYAGALDDFNGGNRAQYFYPVKEGMIFIEQVAKWAAMLGDRKASAVGSLFGSVAEDKTIPQPTFPKCDPWSNIEQLRHEEAVTGFFLSGHPLDNYKRELQSFTNTNVERLSMMRDREVVLGGMITKPEIRLDKNGNKYARFKLQDFSATLEMMLFSENYLKAQNYIEEGKLVLIRGNYQPRWKNSEDYDLKIRTISLLSELRENETKAVDMIISTSNATAENAERLKVICEANPGRCLLGITVFDEQDQTSVRLVAKQFKISPAEEVLKQLEFYAAAPLKLK